MQTPTWCPGCTNFAVMACLKNALAELKILPKDTVVAYDIGCAGNMFNSLAVNGFAGLHGRSIPLAVGIKMANPKLTVIAQGGDGGILSEGANHLIHAAQRDDDITVILNNNYVFGLTAGQSSSGTPKGFKTRSTPEGNLYQPLSSVDLVAVAGGSFIARTLGAEIQKTTEIVKEAIKHKGFSLVEIIQPCIIWAKELAAPKGEWVEKPFSNQSGFISKNDLYGILLNR